MYNSSFDKISVQKETKYLGKIVDKSSIQI
jgi:hypothetical protein